MNRRKRSPKITITQFNHIFNIRKTVINQRFDVINWLLQLFRIVNAGLRETGALETHLHILVQSQRG